MHKNPVLDEFFFFLNPQPKVRRLQDNYLLLDYTNYVKV